MLLDELAVWIEATGVATLPSTGSPQAGGAPLYQGRIPDVPNECVALFETMGEVGAYTHDGPIFDYPRVAIWSRAPGYTSAMTRAALLYRDMKNMISPISLEGPEGIVRYLRFMPIQPPFLIGRDEKDRPVVGFNVRITRVPSHY